MGADNEETAALNKKIIELAWPILYLCDDVIQVKIVLATALMAIARKVIILDYEELEPMYISATGVVLVATGITYYFVHKLPPKSQSEPLEQQQS